MEQQLIESTINILPDTMDEIILKLQNILALLTNDQADILGNIVKSIFYGLWNFDKMINQHHLSMKIAELLVKLPKKNALNFLKVLLTYLNQKWNLIDHHRINKFLQLVRYLLVAGFKMCEKYKIQHSKLDEMLVQIVFKDCETRSGLAYHIVDIYYETCQENAPHGLVQLEQLAIYQYLIQHHQLEHFRLHAIEHSYEKYKLQLISTITHLDLVDQKINQFCEKFIEIAKAQENDLVRKNIYHLVGFMKSQEMSFNQYSREKQAKAQAEKEKKKKKISKFKKVEIKQAKDKKKIKSKSLKKNKQLSVKRFKDRKGRAKGIEEL